MSSRKLLITVPVRSRLVVARLLAARGADAGHRGADRGARAAEVEAELVQLVERLLDVFAGRALEHDVAGLAVEGNQAGAVPLPDVAHLAQHVGVVVHAGRWHHPQGVELGRIGEDRLAGFVLELGEARNDAAAVAEHADRTALPVALARPVRGLELTQQVDDIVLVLRQALQPSDEAWPRTALERVEHRGRMHLLCHVCLLALPRGNSHTGYCLSRKCRRHCGAVVAPRRAVQA